MATTNKSNEIGARDSALLIRLTTDEREQIDAAAESEHLPTGTWLRQLGLKSAKQSSLRNTGNNRGNTMLKFITDDILTACIEPLLERDEFDSHDVIQELSKRREYLDEVYGHRDEQPDAYRITHGFIGKALAAHPLIVKTRKTKSMNIRAGMSENQAWRKK